MLDGKGTPGKEFCNCNHALMLIDAVYRASESLDNPELPIIKTQQILFNAIKQHEKMKIEYHENQK